MINRKEEIKKKGFNMTKVNDQNGIKEANSYNPIDFSKIKVGLKTLDDAILNIQSPLKKLNKNATDKDKIVELLQSQNYEEMRSISNFYYKESGIYSRLCRYMASLYRYDWMVTPYITDAENAKVEDKALINYHKVLNVLDNFGVKKFFNDVALKVMREGSYYGYTIKQDEVHYVVQELSPKYCRSRFKVNNQPAVEFRMSYFDDNFKDAGQKMRVLSLFPSEFKKGYILYKEGKLPPQFAGDEQGWYLLDIDSAFKFNLNDDDMPMFLSIIPAIIDLDEAQELDKKRMAQRLLKIIIQKMPLDKNNELVFDVDEAQELHNNAVRMLGKAIGIDVLTTFADVDVADMDNNNSNSLDELEKIERSIYNEAGVSQMQFNTDGNLALEKSVLNDEASAYNLLAQFELYLNHLIQDFNKTPKKYYYRLQMLTTTIYNYKDLAKMYKEQTQVGYSKLLPQIAMGISQSSILANAYFENHVLNLPALFIPPISSSTMSSETIETISDTDNKSDTGGRPEKDEDEKSEKTIMNEESKN